MEALYSYRELVTNRIPSRKEPGEPRSMDNLFQSLNRYVESLTESRVDGFIEDGSIEQIARRFIKPNRKPRISELRVQTIEFGKIDNTSIVLDTDFGIMVSIPHTEEGVEPKRDCAVLGIDVVDRVELKRYKNRGMNIGAIQDGDVVIAQIQGNNRGEHVLADYQWPRLLTALAVGWAKREGLSMLFFLPAEYQGCWPSQSDADMYRGSQLRRDRMKMLSNISAKRSGFRKTSEKGPYVLSLT